MATHSSILAWRIPWTEKPGRLQSMGSQKSDMTWWLNHHHQDVYINSKLLIYLPTSPLVTISLFSMSVILLLFCKKVHLYHFLDPTYKQYNFISIFFSSPNLYLLTYSLRCLSSQGSSMQSPLRRKHFTVWKTALPTDSQGYLSEFNKSLSFLSIVMCWRFTMWQALIMQI